MSPIFMRSILAQRRPRSYLAATRMLRAVSPGIIRSMPSQPSKIIETVQNPHPDRDYEVTMTVPEFTCLCPITGQPDFATLRIRYVPDQHLVELKSLKLYVWSYRNEGAFHEDVTNRILDDLVAAARPRFMEIVGDFNVRGGIKSEVRASYGKSPTI
jgi:7-cyano-7-deazaguanine reductase